jgi:DnaJ-class molecular chaperone
MINCPECNGTGESTYEVFHPMSFSNPYGDFEERPCTCDNCNGSGEVEPLEDE